MSEVRQMTHEEATELAGLYVLDALEAPEREAVRRHLAECPMLHEEFAEAGGAVPALAMMVEPTDAPADLRRRVLAAIAADAAAGVAAEEAAPPRPLSRPTGVISFERARARREPSWLGWAAAAAAVLVIAVLGAWAVLAQGRATELEQRNALIARAIAASTAEGAAVATLRGTGPAAGASGFAAFTPDGEGYILLVGLPPAPAGQTYQAWYIVDGRASSAGTLAVGSDGYAVLGGVSPMPGIDVIAFTLERAGGVEQPTSDPIIAGEVGA